MTTRLLTLASPHILPRRDQPPAPFKPTSANPHPSSLMNRRLFLKNSAVAMFGMGADFTPQAEMAAKVANRAARHFNTGLRAYYLQPFRIPTGSMQPTLNGIIATPLPMEKWPSFPQRMMEKALRGRSYVRVVNDQDRHLAITKDGRVDILWVNPGQHPLHPDFGPFSISLASAGQVAVSFAKS